MTSELEKAPGEWIFTGYWGDQKCYQRGGLRVIVGVGVPQSDDKTWLHVSAARRDWTPSHDDMARVKRDFIGDHRYAYAVWPPQDRHVNIHPNCLHLWACLDGAGRVLPEFSEMIDGVRSI